MKEAFAGDSSIKKQEQQHFGKAQNASRLLRKQRFQKARRMKMLYLLLLLPIVLVVIFHYLPMYGMLIAFKDYRWGWGVLKSPWNNFEHFKIFFSSPFFGRVLFNTIYISLLRILFGFPAPILLALLVNEINNNTLKKTLQTVSYLPHFMSWVVLASIISEFFSPTRGPVGYVYTLLGIEPVNWLNNPDMFRSLLIVTGIWKEVGWGAIIYLAALSSIDPSLYENAVVDGANRFQRARHITLPSLIPIMTILFILGLGNILEAGFEQIFNLYGPLVYSVADVIDTYIYRAGILDQKYGFTAAVGLFKNTFGLLLILASNFVIRRFSEYGIW
jgi:putative aldouronate transport system permease protein